MGLLAAAATAGALVGFGLREGTPVRPLNGIARLVLGSRADGVWGIDPLVTATGVVVHVTLMFAWGLLYVRLADARSVLARVGLAIVVALAALLLDLFIVERVLGAGGAGVLTIAQVIALHALLAASLVIGMRLASPPV